LPEEGVNGDGEKKTEDEASDASGDDGLSQRSLSCDEKEESLSCDEDGDLGSEDYACNSEKIERYLLMCFCCGSGTVR